MIATFIIDWPVVVLLGIVFGSFGPRDAWWRSPAFAWGIASAAVFAGIALVSYALAPEWMWMYFIDPDDASWSVPLIAAGYIVVFVVAFAAAVAMKDLGMRWMWAIAAGVAGLEAVVLGLTWDRYRVIGSIEQWRAGDGDALLTLTPSGPARTVGLMGATFIAAVAVQVYLLRRRSSAAVAGR